MAVRHALATVGCSHCRSAVLKLFACPANPLTITRAAFILGNSRSIAAAPARKFSSRPYRSYSSSTENPPEEGSKEDDVLDSSELDNHAKESSSTSVPWYLQVEPPRHVVSIEPPPLPEVPEGSPEVVGSLLKYVSEELGLDELELLDLRGIDPPVALGPNLLMLFGTARSERHLTVSAGRLVRWLRAEHRIHPYADGLLGQGERKIKLRRKAKRERLMGVTEDTDDDGIKTGWVCVSLTIGRGKESKEESAVVADDGRVAGFGLSQKGSTLVVQMMTESRRAAMRLEDLWKRAIGQPVDKTLESATEDRPALHPLEESILASSRRPANPTDDHFGNTSRKTPYRQARFYSTQQTLIRGSPDPDPLVEIRSKEELDQILKFDTHQKHRLLELLWARLDGLSTIDISNDQQVLTPFLRLSRLVCRALPPPQTWGFRLALQARACESRDDGLVEALDDSQRLIEEMSLYGIEATRQQCLQLLTCTFSSNTGDLKEQTQLALRLLKTVQQRGQPVLANDIIVTIIEAAARSSERQIKSRDSSELIERLEDVIRRADLPCMDESLIMRLMTVYAKLRNWEGLWNAWRIPPRHLRPRSAAMYIHMFEVAAATGYTSVCTMVLRRCFQEMLAENPPVMPTGAVRKALMQCIHVVDPHAEQLAQSLSAESAGHGGIAKREFVKLVRNIRLLSG
ncbi:hypothetical protein GGR54DRAFT_565942 [Hypoxylon sp. NC1633]|nr:hypothetical protein GGR54DRAFT_565942 [Hypoxylon sp. NC1633]